MNDDVQCSPATAVEMFATQLIGEPAVSLSGKRATSQSSKSALAEHWPEYLIEAACIATFMISACVFTVLLAHPDSPLRSNLPSGGVRRFLGGSAMGLTAIAIVYSPLGRRSGAHMNPAVTLTFFRLGKIQAWDAMFYGVSQFAGGIAGMAAAFAILRSMPAFGSSTFDLCAVVVTLCFQNHVHQRLAF